MKFRKLPVVIDALLFTGDNHQEVRAFQLVPGETPAGIPGSGIAIKTEEGNMTASPGDYIIRGVKGEYYPCKPDIFAATYEPAPEGFEPTKIPTFQGELTHLLNRFGMETMGRGGDTPDHMLASFLIGVLKVYNDAIEARERWFGREAGSKVGVPDAQRRVYEMPFAIPPDNGPGVLEVGENEQGQIVVNLPRDMTGHIIFSTQEAKDLACILARRAVGVENKAAGALRFPSHPIIPKEDAAFDDSIPFEPSTAEDDPHGIGAAAREERPELYQIEPRPNPPAPSSGTNDPQLARPPISEFVG